MSHGGSPLLCHPSEKAEIEAVNTVAQLDYITELVVRQKVKHLRESHVLQLHELSIQNIYPCGGQYRSARFTMKISDAKHVPPPASSIHGLMVDFVETCNDPRIVALNRAAYALWRFNWIHPFAGGNGRTARAIAYLILCIDAGGMMTGVPSIPALIANDRDGYLKALRDTDALRATRHGKERTELARENRRAVPHGHFPGRLVFRPGLQRLASASSLQQVRVPVHANAPGTVATSRTVPDSRPAFSGQ